MFREKKARREERRSFRESDNFIGVQGANSRIGYPDATTGTGSSAGNVVSEWTKQKIEEDEKRMATASREYKAALERRGNEMRRLKMKSARRRRETMGRAERKRAQLKARAREKMDDGETMVNTWGMMTEQVLSSIM